MTTTIHSPVFGKIKPRRKGLAAFLTHHTFPRLTQLAEFAFILGIAIRHLLVGEAGATQVKLLESDTFSTTNLRSWRQTRLGQ